MIKPQAHSRAYLNDVKTIRSYLKETTQINIKGKSSVRTALSRRTHSFTIS